MNVDEKNVIMEEAQRQLESARKFGFREEPKITKKAKRQAQLCKDTAVKLRSQVDKLQVAKHHLVNLLGIIDDEAVVINDMIKISYAAVESLRDITEIGPNGYKVETETDNESEKVKNEGRKGHQS